MSGRPEGFDGFGVGEVDIPARPTMNISLALAGQRHLGGGAALLAEAQSAASGPMELESSVLEKARPGLEKQHHENPYYRRPDVKLVLRPVQSHNTFKRHHTKYNLKEYHLFTTKISATQTKAWILCPRVEREKRAKGGSTYIGRTHRFMQVPSIIPQETAS